MLCIAYYKRRAKGKQSYLFCKKRRKKKHIRAVENKLYEFVKGVCPYEVADIRTPWEIKKFEQKTGKTGDGSLS